MRRRERIPLHDHVDGNAGGPLASSGVQAAVGGIAPGSGGGGSGGGTGSHEHSTFMLNTRGGQPKLVALGAMGTASTANPTLGSDFYGTLDDDCTLTLSAPGGSGGSSLFFWFTQDGTGGHTLDFDATGGTVTGDISAHTTTIGETFRVLAERIPGTSNDWLIDLLGGTASVGALDDLSDVIITSPASGQKLRYNGSAWVNANLHDEPMMATDGTVQTDGLLNPQMHEVAW